MGTKINPSCQADCIVCKDNKAPSIFLVTFSGFDVHGSDDSGTDDNRVMNRTYVLYHVAGTCVWQGEHNAQVWTPAPPDTIGPGPWPISLTLDSDSITVEWQQVSGLFAPSFSFLAGIDAPVDCCALNLKIDKSTSPVNGSHPLHGDNVYVLDPFNGKSPPYNDGATAVIVAVA